MALILISDEDFLPNTQFCSQLFGNAVWRTIEINQIFSNIADLG